MRSPSLLLSEIRTTLQLAIPLGVIQLAEASVSFINSVMMGFLGIESLAAGALGVITFYTLILICMGMVEGGSPLAAEAFGAGDTDRIRHIFAQGLWLVLVLCLPMMLLLWHLDSILIMLGQQEQTVTLTSTYLKAIVWGCPAAVGFFIMKEVSTALNRPHLISAIALTSIPINITANYLLLFGHLGLPELGLAGIGWAGTVVFWVNFLAAAAILGFHPSFKEYKLFSCLGFDGEIFAELWQNGWPVGLEYGSILLIFTLIALLSGYMGTILLAANEIVVQTIDLFLIVPIATSYAVATRVGQMFGQNDPKSAKRSGFAAITICIVTTGLIGIALWLFPEQIANIYLDSTDADHGLIITTTIPLLRIAAIFLIAYGLNVVAMGLLMGIQNIKSPLLINILIHWSIGMASAYLLCFKLHLGSIGLWLGLTIGTALGTIFLIYRFYVLTSELIKQQDNEKELDRSKTTNGDQTPVLKSVY
jgi:multidrug resistance protein, MATE family